jgi:predicted transcriptional regulator
VVYGIVTKNLSKEEFPLVCEDSKKEYFRLAKKGWRLMKEYSALLKLHPTENAE